MARLAKRILEKDIQRLVVDWLSAKRIWHMRVQSGKVKSAMGGWIQLAPAGTADYVAMVPVEYPVIRVGATEERSRRQEVTWLELKRPKGGVHTELQKSFQKQVQELGHRYFLITSLEDLEAAFQ